MTEVVNNPIYATGVGLLIHGFRQMDLGRAPAMKGEDAPSLFERMKSWFTGHF
jgi:cell division protein FtsA